MSILLSANSWSGRIVAVLILTVVVWSLMYWCSEFLEGRFSEDYQNTRAGQKAALSTQKGYEDLVVDSVLYRDGNVRHCVSNNVIGHVNRSYAKKVLVTNFASDSTGGGGEASTNRRESFKAVFNNRVWVGGKGAKPDTSYDGIQASGPGSLLRVVQELTGALHVIIDQIKARHRLSRVRLLDIPCGDMAWMSRLLETRPDVDYVGFDIVPDLIENHRKMYTGRHPNWQFFHVDVVSEGINSSFTNFNLVLSRHMLQHLKTSDVFRVLGHISDLAKRQPAPVYFFTTTWSRANGNGELDVNDPHRFRSLNLELPPFSLEPPLCLLNDGRPPDMLCCYLGLWRLPLQQVVDCSSGAKANKVVNTFGFESNLHSCVGWAGQA